jgi:hypothetical protein
MNDKTIAGLLIIAVTTLASVVVYLFKLLLAQSKESKSTDAAIIKEREGWSAERAKLAHDAQLERQRLALEFEMKEQELRADYEKRHREIIERYDAIARNDSKRMLEHEDEVRKDFADIMERVSAEDSKSNDAMVQLLNKFYDRLVGPRGY